MEHDDWHLLKRYYAGECSPEEITRLPAEFTTAEGRQVFSELLRAVDPKIEWRASHDSTAAYEHFRAKIAEHPATDASEVMPNRFFKKNIWAGRSPTGQHMLRMLSLCVAGLAIIAGVTTIFSRQRVAPTSGVTRQYTTSTSPHSIMLDDGTQVMLAPYTSFRLVGFSATSRTVTVDGEAYFDVVPSSHAPFIVRSRNAIVRVLGTSFVVRNSSDRRTVHVAVMSGKVVLSAIGLSDAATPLSAGYIGDVNDSTVRVAPASNDFASEVESRQGNFVFRHMPLSSVLETLTRWYGYQFRCADSTLGRRTMTVWLSQRSSAAAVATLEDLLDVSSTIVGDTITLASRASSKHPPTPRTRAYDVWTPNHEVGR